MDGEIIRSIKRSRTRVDILKYLANIYPDKAYLSQIAFALDKQATTVNSALTGSGHNYAKESSPLSLKLVSIIDRSGRKYYQLNRPFADEVLQLINTVKTVEVEI